MGQVGNGVILSPILHGFLSSAKYPDEFTVNFKKHGKERAPDGWFHPSTHPLWGERQLWYYLKNTEGLVSREMEYMGALSTSMGTAVHEFIQMCLTTQGVLTDTEVYVADEKHKSHGSMDGVLDIPRWGQGVFEFKTTNNVALNSIMDNDIEALKKKWMPYYAQVQEYMRISGYSKAIILFMGMGYPWTLKEFQVDFDEAWALSVAKKYENVIAAYQANEMPEPCCAPGSKKSTECFARMVCPIAQMKV